MQSATHVERTNFHQSPNAPASADCVIAMLLDLQSAVQEIRAYVAGAVKSHYTVDEVAAMTGRAPYTVRSRITAGRLRAERVTGTGPRGRLLIPRVELQKLISGGRGARVPDIVADS